MRWRLRLRRVTATLLIGTRGGLFNLHEDALDAERDDGFGDRDVTALTAGGDGSVWAVADRHTLVRRDAAGAWSDVAGVETAEITCVTPTSDGVVAGTEEAHVLRLEDGALTREESFEAVDGRDGWYTPWGGPPAVRTMAFDRAGRIHANVHVGGIPRSLDGGQTWTPTIDIDADIHQVIAHPSESDVVLAAGAVGLAISQDGGATWRIEREGLHRTYARAVAVAGETILLTVSNGPRGGGAAVYRTRLGAGVRLDKCSDGLPEWFDGNIDSGWLAAVGSRAAFGTSAGEVYVSDDEGERWGRAADHLPPIRALAFA
jgi:hypothetical protein